jgi:hypothetical protein
MSTLLGKPVADLLPVTGSVDIYDRAQSERLFIGRGSDSLLDRLRSVADPLGRRGQLPASFQMESLIDARWLVQRTRGGGP